MDSKPTKAGRILAGAFLAVLILFMESIICVYSMKKILGKNSINVLIDKEIKEQSVKEWQRERNKIDWKKIYPFEEEKNSPSTEQKHKANNTKEKSATLSLPERIHAAVKKWAEIYAKDYLVGRMFFVNNAKLYEKTIRWNMASMAEYNAVVTLNDGHLTWFSRKRNVSEKTTVELAEYCKQKSISFLYVNAPCIMCKIEDVGISGVLDFSNQNADEFLKLLDDAKVTYYDLREALHNEGMLHHDLFFRTDHHWLPSAGLWAAQHILQFLCDKYGYQIDTSILDAKKFAYVRYPAWSLGSQGKKVTLANTEPEDFDLYYPKYNTLLHYQVPNLNIDIKGDFSVTYDMSQIEKKDYYNKYPYWAYNHGDRPLVIIENEMIDKDIKLLIIHESFADCVIPFLSLGIKRIDALDLRHFSGSVRSYINYAKPNIVIVIYNTDIAGARGRLFDFR